MVVSITSPELRTLNFETVGRSAHFFFCRSAPLPPGPPEQRRRSVQEPQDDVGGVLALQESSPFPIGTEPIQFKIKIWPNRDTAGGSLKT